MAPRSRRPERHSDQPEELAKPGPKSTWLSYAFALAGVASMLSVCYWLMFSGMLAPARDWLMGSAYDSRFEELLKEAIVVVVAAFVPLLSLLPALCVTWVVSVFIDGLGVKRRKGEPR
jgi:hypothetical protein